MKEQLLYHYTTMNTFYAMMKDSLCYEKGDSHPQYLTLWATNYAYQNDFTECKLFLYALERAVEKYVKAKNIILPSESRKLLHESILGMGIYTISFSEHDDDLTMWRGYGQDGGTVLALVLIFQNYQRHQWQVAMIPNRKLKHQK